MIFAMIYFEHNSFLPLLEKCPNMKLFLVRIFQENTGKSGLNTGKYGPEITPYFDTFHVVYI